MAIPYPVTPILDWLGFRLGVTPVIPKFYYDAYSQEEIIKELSKELDCLAKYAQYLGTHVNEDRELLNTVVATLNKLQDGGWFDLYASELEPWINANMERIISAAIKMVFFGLTDDGHFVAYIPDSWSDIQFDTILNYQNEYYGHLVLRYYVNNEAESVTQPVTS